MLPVRCIISILCQKDSYFLELVHYIHLNPLRAKLVADMKELDQYAYCGHGVLMGEVAAEWQNTAYIARMFDKHLPTARRRYRDFVQWIKGKQPNVV
jgi:REP-associated tyrosine transposase